MRTIKFRAFDKTNKRMMIFDDFWACDEYQLLGWMINQDSKLVSEGNYCLDWDMQNLEIMQLTGLLDKNGKEIYEGDIVKSTYNARHVNYNSAIEETLMVVEHDDCNPCFVLVGVTNKNKREYDFIQCGLRTNEVIGNIYESPYLINNQKEK